MGIVRTFDRNLASQEETVNATKSLSLRMLTALSQAALTDAATTTNITVYSNTFNPAIRYSKTGGNIQLLVSKATARSFELDIETNVASTTGIGRYTVSSVQTAAQILYFLTTFVGDAVTAVDTDIRIWGLP